MGGYSRDSCTSLKREDRGTLMPSPCSTPGRDLPSDRGSCGWRQHGLTLVQLRHDHPDRPERLDGRGAGNPLPASIPYLFWVFSAIDLISFTVFSGLSISYRLSVLYLQPGISKSRDQPAPGLPPPRSPSSTCLRLRRSMLPFLIPVDLRVLRVLQLFRNYPDPEARAILAGNTDVRPRHRGEEGAADNLACDPALCHRDRAAP